MKDNATPIYLKPGKERALLNFHPWIFSGALKKVPLNLSPGSVVQVCDHQGKALALGHFCGPEGLVVRIFSFDSNATNDIWQKKFQAAWRLRQLLGFPSRESTGFRLIHGEGDGLSGLVVDIFGTAMSIKVSNPGLNGILSELVSFFSPLLQLDYVSVERAYDQSHELMLGHSQKISFLEHGLSFNADPEQGQKTGHFLDQRENRLLLQQMSKGRRILDAFCYSGGFTTYALKGGAAKVVSIDISEHAIAQCKDHVALNGPFLGTHEGVVADCFNYLREIKANDFDLMVLDPPAFAKSAASVMRASRGYKDINLVAMKALPPGGLLWTFSCSQHISADLFQKIIFASAKDAQRSVKILYELHQGPDHPVSVFCPQSSYLKGLVLQVD